MTQRPSAFGEANNNYNVWLSEWVTVDEAALAVKQKKMAESDFAFLRATFFRWIQQWVAAASEADASSVYSAPSVLSVGDIHLENFGIWRDRDGRLAWGVNDFDEACVLPYTQDLLRLSVSVLLASALDDGKDGPSLHLPVATALQALLSGYQTAVTAGREAANPIVLAEDNDWLRTIALAQITDAAKFWKKEQGPKKAEPLDAASVPEEAYNALGVLWPDPLSVPGKERHWYRRQAGLGSLGRPRYALFGFWYGGTIAREAKALVPSAYYWASDARHIRYHLEQALAKAIRAPDPVLKVVDQWLVRRIAPDCIKLETGALATTDQQRMLEAMGREIANVHLGGAPAETVAAIQKDLVRRTKRDPNWLRTNTEALAAAVRKDRKSLSS